MGRNVTSLVGTKPYSSNRRNDMAKKRHKTSDAGAKRIEGFKYLGEKPGKKAHSKKRVAGK